MLLQAPGATPQDQPLSPTVPAFGDPRAYHGRAPGCPSLCISHEDIEVGYFRVVGFFPLLDLPMS